MTLQGPVLPSAATSAALTTSYTSFVYTGTAAAAWTFMAVTGHTGVVQFVANESATATLTLTCPGSDHVSAGGKLFTTVTLTPGETLQILCDGTYWLVIDRYPVKFPTFDNVTQKTLTASKTWSHMVGEGRMGAVMVVAGAGTPLPSSITAVVSLGGVVFADHGWAQSTLGIMDNSWFWYFFAADIPAGTQTASATGFPNGTDVYCLSYYDCGFAAPYACFNNGITYQNYQVQWGFVAACRRITNGPGRIVTATDSAPDDGSTTARIEGWAAGDHGVCGGETARAGFHVSSNLWHHTAMLELLSAPPIEPWINAVGPGAKSAWTHKGALAGSYALVFAWATTVSGVGWAGEAMDELGAFHMAGSTYLKVYGLADVAAGNAAVSVSGTGTIWGTSFTLSNVSSIGDITTKGAAAAGDFSHDVAPTPGQLIIQCTASDNSYGNDDYDPQPLYLDGNLYIHQTLVPFTYELVSTVYLGNGNYGAIAVAVN